MTIEQTIEIPADRRISLELPQSVPAGKARITVTPCTEQEHQVYAEMADLKAYLAANTPRTAEEAIRQAAAKAADPNRKPLSRYRGTMKNAFGGDGVAYQRKLRDEWDE